MLIYKRTEEKRELEFTGNGFDLVAEVTFMVNEIFNQLYRQSPPAAAAFRNAFIAVVEDKKSPAWGLAPPSDGETSTCIVVRKPRNNETGV